MTDFEIKQKLIDKYYLYYFPSALDVDTNNNRLVTGNMIQQMLQRGKQLLPRLLSSPSAAALSQYVVGVLNLCVYFTLKARPDLNKKFQEAQLKQSELAMVDNLIANLNKLNINVYGSFDKQMTDAIRIAGSYPLIMMESCVPATLQMYLRFVNEINDLANLPPLPAGDPKDIGISPLEVKIMQPQILPPVFSRDFSNDQEKLNHLKQYVNLAKDMYIKHSNSIWFSLFHFHGQRGRNRANKFATEFQNSTSYQDALNNLVQFLENSQNGNTHPHSFRTMLLSTLIGNEYTSYSEVSKTYAKNLDLFQSRQPVQNVVTNEAPSNIAALR